jgi:hypothetical protein
MTKTTREEKYHPSSSYEIPPWERHQHRIIVHRRKVCDPNAQIPKQSTGGPPGQEKLCTSGLAKEIAAIMLQDIEVLEKANAPGTAGQISRLKNNIKLLQLEADHEHTIVLSC